MPLFLLFLIVPLIEIALFIQIGGWIGLGWTLVTVVATAIIGATLVRRQGAGVMAQVQKSFHTLQDPSQPLAEGAMILFSGALLLTPGFFTDAVGFALLVPQVRQALFQAVRSRITFASAQGFSSQNHNSQDFSHRHPQSDDVIEGDYQVEDPNSTDQPKGPSGWTRH